MLDLTINGALVGGFIGTIGTLLGVWVAQRHAEGQARLSREIAYIEKQVNEFYAPIMGLYRQARALEDVIDKVLDAAKENKKKESETEARPSHEVDPLRSINVYSKGNGQRMKECYFQMHILFRDKMHLSPDVTENDYRLILELIEFWKWTESAYYSAEAVDPIAPDQGKIEAIFDKIERGLAEKQRIISSGELSTRISASRDKAQLPAVNAIQSAIDSVDE